MESTTAIILGYLGVALMVGLSGVASCIGTSIAGMASVGAMKKNAAKGTTWGTVCEQQSAAIRTFAKIRAHGGHKYKERRRKRVYRYIFPAKERKYS